MDNVAAVSTARTRPGKVVAAAAAKAAAAFLLLGAISSCKLPAPFGARTQPSAPAANTGNNNGGVPYKVVAETTPFFKIGPQQANGPDLSLKRDTRLSLLKHSFGYSQVRLEDGQTGMVGNEDIRALTPQEIAALAPPPSTQTPPGRSPLFGATNPPRRPRFHGPALPIPPDSQEPSLPTPDASPTPRPGPTPKFRF